MPLPQKLIQLSPLAPASLTFYADLKAHILQYNHTATPTQLSTLEHLSFLGMIGFITLYIYIQVRERENKHVKTT